VVERNLRKLRRARERTTAMMRGGKMRGRTLYQA
jgi:hypothetical protein